MTCMLDIAKVCRIKVRLKVCLLHRELLILVSYHVT